MDCGHRRLPDGGCRSGNCECPLCLYARYRLRAAGQTSHAVFRAVSGYRRFFAGFARHCCVSFRQAFMKSTAKRDIRSGSPFLRCCFIGKSVCAVLRGLKPSHGIVRCRVQKKSNVPRSERSHTGRKSNVPRSECSCTGKKRCAAKRTLPRRAKKRRAAKRTLLRRKKRGAERTLYPCGMRIARRFDAFCPASVLPDKLFAFK